MQNYNKKYYGKVLQVVNSKRVINVRYKYKPSKIKVSFLVGFNALVLLNILNIINLVVLIMGE